MTTLLLLLTACATPEPLGGRGDAPAGRPTCRRSTTICPDDVTIDGIDVSYWQGSIDWDDVAADGIRFAFIRVSYGLEIYDDRFPENWDGARDAGVVRGAYQYFLAGDDAEEQAWFLLDEMGPLEDDDLPPVLDVENYGNHESQSTVRAGIETWVDVITDEIGRPPLIYTSASAWSSMTGDMTPPRDAPLWVANWEADCPWVPSSWDAWEFWQTTDSGSVDGISGAVDLDLYNGSLDDLRDWAGAGTSTAEDPCSADCAVASDDETVVEEDSACGCPTGGEMYETSGHGGHAWWTSVDVAEPHYAEGVNWMLTFKEAGRYEIAAYIPSVVGLTSGARYKVFHGSESTYAVVDQASAAGDWLELGTFEFQAGGDQWIRLGDNYDDPADAGANIAFDALRLTPEGWDPGQTEDTGGTTGNDTGATGSSGGEGGDACECEDGDERSIACTGGGARAKTCDDCAWSEWSECPVVEPGGCGCASSRRAAPMLLLLISLMALPRRRADA